MNLFFILVAAFYLFCVASSQTLPPCSRYADTNGSWWPASQFNSSNLGSMEKLGTYFHEGFSGEALSFTNIWLPNNCSYRRFDTKRIYDVVYNKITAIAEMQRAAGVATDSTLATTKHTALEIVFIGDSNLRGMLLQEALSIVCFLTSCLTSFFTYDRNSVRHDKDTLRKRVGWPKFERHLRRSS